MLSPEVENDLKARGSHKLNYSFIDSMIYNYILQFWSIAASSFKSILQSSSSAYNGSFRKRDTIEAV